MSKSDLSRRQFNSSLALGVGAVAAGASGVSAALPAAGPSDAELKRQIDDRVFNRAASTSASRDQFIGDPKLTWGGQQPPLGQFISQGGGGLWLPVTGGFAAFYSKFDEVPYMRFSRFEPKDGGKMDEWLPECFAAIVFAAVWPEPHFVAVKKDQMSFYQSFSNDLVPVVFHPTRGVVGILLKGVQCGGNHQKIYELHHLEGHPLYRKCEIPLPPWMA